MTKRKTDETQNKMQGSRLKPNHIDDYIKYK